MWEDLELASSSTIARTVLESLMPTASQIAVQQHLAPGWQEAVISGLAEAIRIAKCSENPTLAQNDDMQEAIRAGEIWALSTFHENVKRFPTPEEAVTWLMQHVIRGVGTRKNLTARIREQVMANETIRALCPAEADNNLPATWGRVTFTQYVVWLAITMQASPNNTTIAQTLVHYVAGMCKMGTMTNNWARSRINQIKREANNPDLILNKKVCEFVWDFYGQAYSIVNRNFGEYFIYLQNTCEAKNLTRLFITAQQSADAGAAVVMMIADAISNCDGFNWARFDNARCPAERRIASELTIFREELNALRQNPWLRFGGGAGKSLKMANIGYLAKQLLLKTGQQSVADYGGLDAGGATIQHKIWIDRIVGNYVTAVADAQEGEEHPIMGDPGHGTN